MELVTKACLSYDGSQATFIGEETLVFQCANSIKFCNTHTDEENFLGGRGAGISKVVTCTKTRNVIYACKGNKPEVFVYSFPGLKLLSTLSGAAELEITGLAVSRDGKHVAIAGGLPDLSLTLWELGAGGAPTLLNRAKLESECAQISFNPRDSNELCCVDSAGVVNLWKLTKLFTSYTFGSWDPVGSQDPVTVTAHGWSPDNALVIGCKSGETYALDMKLHEAGSVLPRKLLSDAAEEGAAEVAVTCIGIAKDYVLAGCADGHLAWYPELSKTAQSYRTKVVAQGGEITCISLAPNYEAVWVGSRAGTLVRAPPPGRPPPPPLLWARGFGCSRACADPDSPSLHGVCTRCPRAPDACHPLRSAPGRRR